MIEQRPDWCVSRQRAWGVPIAVFVDKATGEPLRDPEVMDRVAEAFEAEGADAWFESPPERFLGNKYKAEDYEQVTDILDVWFELGLARTSSCSRAIPSCKWPADLYLEGSDQHRGWFHSSLLESCGTRGRAPYDGVLTHGFTLDEQGRKMSKSLGNITAPQDGVRPVRRRHPAPVGGRHRLHRGPAHRPGDPEAPGRGLSPPAQHAALPAGQPRRLLGGGEGRPMPTCPSSSAGCCIAWPSSMRMFRQAVDDFDFHKIATELHNFCAVDLSAFYFDIRKDAIYCDAPDALRRRAARTVMAELFSFLTAWLAPITCFTAEEAWLARPRTCRTARRRACICGSIPRSPPAWLDAALGEKWKTVRALRRVVTGALELERAEKRIGSSLQAAPHVHVAPEYVAAMKGLDLAEICITSGGELVEGEPAGGRLHARPTWRASASCRCWPTATNAHAAGRCCRRSASRPSTRCSASAAKAAVEGLA